VKIARVLPIRAPARKLLPDPLGIRRKKPTLVSAHNRVGLDGGDGRRRGKQRDGIGQRVDRPAEMGQVEEGEKKEKDR
jgi:hypothetical protein